MFSFSFKGVSSDSFTGLIVSELPPVTIPPQRFEQIEIDGKDGDIINLLGRGAYDKEILLGLSHGYDLNAIASWLSGSGNLILSNEPDKYYEACILEQVDFSRLVRFKTATVRFHVQPYKYPVSETRVDVRPVASTYTLTLNNLGNAEALPYMTIILDSTISAEGYLTCKKNNSSGAEIFKFDFTHHVGTLNFDCKAYDVSTGSGGKNTFMYGSFPVLAPGQNSFYFKCDDGMKINRIIVSGISRWL